MEPGRAHSSVASDVFVWGQSSAFTSSCSSRKQLPFRRGSPGRRSISPLHSPVLPPPLPLRSGCILDARYTPITAGPSQQAGRHGPLSLRLRRGWPLSSRLRGKRSQKSLRPIPLAKQPHTTRKRALHHPQKSPASLAHRSPKEALQAFESARLKKPCRLLRALSSNTSNPQPSTLNPQPSTLNPQPSTLNPQPASAP
jgi:hypothetical protein